MVSQEGTADSAAAAAEAGSGTDAEVCTADALRLYSAGSTSQTEHSAVHEVVLCTEAEVGAQLVEAEVYAQFVDVELQLVYALLVEVELVYALPLVVGHIEAQLVEQVFGQLADDDAGKGFVGGLDGLVDNEMVVLVDEAELADTELEHIAGHAEVVCEPAEVVCEPADADIDDVSALAAAALVGTEDRLEKAVGIGTKARGTAAVELAPAVLRGPAAGGHVGPPGRGSHR